MSRQSSRDIIPLPCTSSISSNSLTVYLIHAHKETIPEGKQAFFIFNRNESTTLWIVLMKSVLPPGWDQLGDALVMTKRPPERNSMYGGEFSPLYGFSQL